MVGANKANARAAVSEYVARVCPRRHRRRGEKIVEPLEAHGEEREETDRELVRYVCACVCVCVCACVGMVHWWLNVHPKAQRMYYTPTSSISSRFLRVSSSSCAMRAPRMVATCYSLFVHHSPGPYPRTAP